MKIYCRNKLIRKLQKWIKISSNVKSFILWNNLDSEILRHIEALRTLKNVKDFKGGELTYRNLDTICRTSLTWDPLQIKLQSTTESGATGFEMETASNTFSSFFFRSALSPPRKFSSLLRFIIATAKPSFFRRGGENGNLCIKPLESFDFHYSLHATAFSASDKNHENFSH